MVGLQKFARSWSYERCNFPGAMPGPRREPVRANIVEMSQLQAVLRIKQGGDLSDLTFNRKMGGSGRFDENGNTVIFRRFSS